MATKIATNGPGGPVVAGDHLRRDSSLLYIYTPCVRIREWGPRNQPRTGGAY